ncbi:hypothetical protein DV737_g1316, partial [Chaetothyriales sp. CBS 132003]
MSTALPHESDEGLLRLVRAYSLKADEEADATDVVRAVADFTRDDLELDREAELRVLFDDPNATSKISIRDLDVEANRLEKAMKMFKAGNDAPKSIYSLRDLASAEHRKTCAVIAKALVDINKAVGHAHLDCKVIKSEPLMMAVANLYAAIFIFYADAIKWYDSSSSRKARYALHEGFSDRFKESIEEIKSLSEHVRRIAELGSSAETSYTRIKMEQLERNCRAGLEGHERILQDIKSNVQAIRAEQTAYRERQKLLAKSEHQALLQRQLFRLIGESGTKVLYSEAQRFIASEREVVEQSVSFDEQQQPEIVPVEMKLMKEEEPVSAPPRLERDMMQTLSASLCNHIQRGSPMPNFEPRPGFIGHSLTVNALEEWILARDSRVLCIEGPTTLSMRDSEMSAGAARIVYSAVDLGFPSISFFCEAIPEEKSVDDIKRAKTNDLTGLVFSLIHQLICLLPPILDEGTQIDPSKLESLSTNPSYDVALEVLASTLASKPPMLLIVIDGLQAFSDRDGTQVPRLMDADTVFPCLKDHEYLRVAEASSKPGPGKLQSQII